MINFACPHCGNQLRAPETRVGSLARCPKCSQDFTIPEAGAASPPAPPAAAAAPAAEVPAKPSLAARLVRLLVSLVLIVVVLLGALWGGMAWRAGSVERAPKTFAEFWNRLAQQPPK